MTRLCLVSVVSLLPLAWSHGQLTVPLVRGDSQGRRESHEQRAPVYTLGGNRGGYSETSMRCHDFAAESTPPSTLVAGQSFEATWTMEAGHPGDCYFYLSYDDPTVATNFFKIASVPGCGAADGLNIPSSVTTTVQLPAELPACEHCVLRWEWTGHQQVVDIEFYVQCADVKITSSASATKPEPMTAISGIEHLPQDASEYRQVYQQQRPDEQYLVGPAVATYSPCSPGTAGCIGSGAGAGTTATTPAATTATTAAGAGAATTAESRGESGSPSTTRARAPSGATPDGCPLPGLGLPSFVTECYCGFTTTGEGCGPDDGSACWCRCCCHHREGTCRYREVAEMESSFACSLRTLWALGLLALGSFS